MQNLIDIALAAGASGTGLAKVADISFNPKFRDACEQNVCGKFGTCWMCPPDVGDINEMISYAKTFENIFVFQTIGQLEDSFDIEGMEDAAKKHNALVATLAKNCNRVLENYLILGAGACHICLSCTKPENKPCAHPKKAIPSLEAYGVAVAELAKISGLAYINGVNTVTFFGGIMFN